MRFIGLALLFIVSCGKDSGTTSTVAASSAIELIDIIDAAKLFVTGEDPVGLYLDNSEVLKPKTLYKVDTVGKVKEVGFSDSSGNSVSKGELVNQIETPNKNVVVLGFADKSQFIVNKQNGKAYSMTNGLSLHKAVSGEADSDLWAIKKSAFTNEAKLAKAVFADGNLTLQDLSAQSDSVTAFHKTSGDTFVYKSATGYKKLVSGVFGNLPDLTCANKTQTGEIFGYKVGSGSTEISNAITGAVVADLKGSDIVLHYAESADMAITAVKIYDASATLVWCRELNITDPACTNITDTATTAIVSQIHQSGYGTAIYDAANRTIEVNPNTGYSINISGGSWNNVGINPAVCGEGVARIGSKIVTKSSSGLEYLEIFDETDQSLRFIAIRFDLTNVQASDKYVYGIGNGKLHRIDLDARTVTEVSIPDLLEVKAYTVAKNDSLTVNGSLTDGSSFIGELSSTGDFDVLSKTGTGTVTIINPME